MKAPDWGAYLAGKTSPEEREMLDSLLGSSEHARKELEGFVAFQKSVGEEVRKEEIPLESLERVLSEVSSAGPRTARPIALRVALAAAILVVAFFGYRLITFDPMRLNTTPTKARIETRDPLYARNWIREKTAFEAPLVRLGGEATLVGARHGEGWACYDYEVDGQEFFLYMSPNGQALRNGKPGVLDGCSVWKGKGIGWTAGRYAYYLRGGGEQTTAKLAAAALEETGASQAPPP